MYTKVYSTLPILQLLYHGPACHSTSSRAATVSGGRGRRQYFITQAPSINPSIPKAVVFPDSASELRGRRRSKERGGAGSNGAAGL